MIEEKLASLGLMSDPRYRFLLAPLGLLISLSEKMELEAIARAVASFIRSVDEWYGKEREKKGGSRWLGILHAGIPKEYADLSWKPGLPETTMVDLVLTTLGWRIVEIDVTNRNGLGFPALWRHLYGLPAIWGENHGHWIEQGWQGATQIMSERQRFYEPYFKFFLSQLGGKLVRENELEAWLQTAGSGVKLLDLPILYTHQQVVKQLFLKLPQWLIAIPPKHHLSSKAVLALPWEEDQFKSESVKEYLPTTRLLCRSRPLPEDDFFVKMLQSGGAHGTFHGDRSKLDELHKLVKPGAIWQNALPIAKRRLACLDEGGALVENDFFLRFTIFVSPDGIIRDADVTAANSSIVHGSTQSAFTVPIMG